MCLDHGVFALTPEQWVARLVARIESIDSDSRRLAVADYSTADVQGLSRQLQGLAAAAAVFDMSPLAEIAAALGDLYLASGKSATRGTALPVSGAMKELLGDLREYAIPAPLFQPPVVRTPVEPADSHGPLIFFALTDNGHAHLLAAGLRRRGYQTLLYESVDALQAACENRRQPAPAAVVTDVLLPSGKALKAQGIAVLRFGEESGQQPRQEAVQAGADRYLVSPVTASRLLEALEGLLIRDPVRVFLVDDDALSLDARSAVLRSAGFEVAELQSPLQVEDVLQAQPMDVVLLDAAMAGVTELVAVLASVDEAYPDSVLLAGSPMNGLPGVARLEPGRGLVGAVAAVARRTRRHLAVATELKVQLEQRKQAALVIDSHALVSITDQKGRITYANDQFCAVSGYSRDELLGQDHRIVKSGEHPPEFYRELWRTISGGGIWKGVICNRRKDGRLYWVVSTISPYLDEQGKPVSYVSLRTEVTDIKHLEQQVRLLDLAIGQATNGIVIVDALVEGLPLIYTNSAFESITGYSRQEVLGRNCRFMHNDDVDQAPLVDVRAAIKSGHAVAAVLRNYRKDGSLFWNDLNISPVHDERGRLTHFIGIQRDITERVRNEDWLNEVQDNLRATLEATEDGILAIDAQRRVLFYSQRLEELAMLSPGTVSPGDECIMKSDHVRHWVKDPEGFAIRLEEIYSKPAEASHDVFERMDGRIIERDSLPLLRNGEVAGRVWHFKDVTDIRWIRNEMESYKERLRLGQSYANIGTWDWSILSGEMFWTERIPALLGYPEGELKTSFDNFIAAVHPEDRQSVLDAVQSSIEKSAPYAIEHRVIWPDGTVRWLSEAGAVVRDDRGVATRMIGVVQDIDDRKRSEIELLATREEAERANQAKSEFLSRMSHELRTPMNAVLGFAQIMEYDEALSAENVDNVGEIIRAGGHLLKLINEVLDLSKVESGTIDLSIEPVSLCSVVEECLPLISTMAERRGITVEHSVCSATVVRADRMRLKQCLLNLMSNGIKYNRDAGHLKVDVTEVKDGGWVQVRVSDTGRGLRKDQLERVFEPFDRLGIDGGEVEGTGIGLAITRRLIEMMGGSLGVDSVPGHGSTFWVELQKDQSIWSNPDEQNPEDVETFGGGAGGPVIERTVLYVEDNPSNIRLMSQVLSRRHNVRLITAHSPDLGIELAISRIPDVIILDINLPGLDGYQVLRVLRTESRLREVPIIALSANALPRDIDRGKEAGFYEYITKPLQINYFLTILDQIFSDSDSDSVIEHE